MTKQKNVLDHSLTILTSMTTSLTPSALSPFLHSLSSSSISPTTKLPMESPTKQTRKHHRKLSLLYKQVEHLELKLLFKKAFIEKELLCKLELARKIKDDASEFELNGLVELNQIRSKLMILQTRNRQQISKDTRKKIEQNKSQKHHDAPNRRKGHFKTNSCPSSKRSLPLNDKKEPRSIGLDDLSIDELLTLLDQKENEMKSVIQSSQDQIEELLKDAYDYLEEEEYLKLDIQDIKLEIEDLETMCI